MNEEKENKRKQEDILNAGIAGAAYETIQKYGDAAKQHYVAYSGVDNEAGKTLVKGLKQIAEENVNPDYKFQNIHQQAGFAAEVKDVARFNADSIIKENSVRKIRTDDLGRVNDPLYDTVTIDVDGNAANSERKIFDSICNELNVESDMKKEIIDECNMIVAENTSILDVITTEGLDEKIKQGWLFELSSDSTRARIIWNMVNLGYADSEYSMEEKEIVNYLLDKWSVNEEVYQEFIDTEETIASLYKYKEWIAATFPKGDMREKKEADVENEVKMLLEDVQLTIKELTM